VTNWTASISEDLLVIGGLWTALHHPVLFLIGLVVFVVLMIWLLPKLWRLLKRIFRRIGSWLGLCEPPQPEPVSPKADDVKQIRS
jgi:hypothetical protein